MSSPIYDGMKSLVDATRNTARIEARVELLRELKAIPKPVKQVQDLIRKYENAGFIAK